MTRAGNGWERQERGWHTHPRLGGIVRERSGWYWHPMRGCACGPYRTLREARHAAALSLLRPRCPDQDGYIDNPSRGY